MTQLGARRHYLVPVALHERGLLERFCTDLYFPPGLLSRSIQVGAASLRHRGITRLAARYDLGLPREKVRRFLGFGMQLKLQAALARRNGSMTKTWIWGGKTFSRLCARQNFGAATAVYAFTSAALETFQAAKQRGLKCILDHATAPRKLELDLVQQEYDRYPEWGANVQVDRWTEQYTERQRQEAELADVILCGSSFVKQMVEQSWGFGHKCAVVPLGLRTSPCGSVKESSQKRRLRVLFVGDEPVRKGLPELHAALQMMPHDLCDVRVVGHLQLNDFALQQMKKCMTVLGPVPRSEMALQYQWADVLVLPSASDTYGLVVLEALSQGVPVIASTNTGASDAIQQGRNGYVIPPFSPAAIASHLEFLSERRDVLESLSAAASNSVSEFSLAGYSNKLTTAIKQSLLSI